MDMGRCEIATLSVAGITCKTDMGMVDIHNYDKQEGRLYLLSLYGTPSQVLAIFSILSKSALVDINLPCGRRLKVGRTSDPLRFRTVKMGWGKQHGLIFADTDKGLVYWLNPEDRCRTLDTLLSRGRIVYDKKWLPEMENLLLSHGYLTTLTGWGGLGGYIANWTDKDEDVICDIVAANVDNFEASLEKAA